jgi:hypothetical protein
MADCDLRADKIKYEEQGLTNLIQNYNRCKGVVGVTFKTKKPWARLNLNIFSGIDISNEKLDGLSTYSMSNSISMPVGASLEFSAPRLSDKSYFDLELWYVKKFFQGYDESGSLSYIIRSDLFLDASFLKVPFGFRYNFLHEGHTPYIKLGLVQYFTLNVSAQILSEAENSGVVSTYRSDMTLNSRNPYGFWIGAGFTKKISSKVSGFLEVRYEKNNGFTSPSANSSASGSAVNFLIGLKF